MCKTSTDRSGSGFTAVRTRQLYLAIAAAAALPVLALISARLFGQVPIVRMTRDVAALAGVHPLTGFLSSLGILLWWASAAIYLHTAAVVRRVGTVATDPSAGFLTSSGLLSAYLALDDLFQIHEHLAPEYLGVPERGVYAVLGLATGAYLWHYRRLLREGECRLLWLALAGLAVSVAVDALLERWLWRLGDWLYLLEDGTKWLGICCWAAFCAATCAGRLRALARADVDGGPALR